jgi:hypothetical protein
MRRHLIFTAIPTLLLGVWPLGLYIIARTALKTCLKTITITRICAEIQAQFDEL